MAKESSAKAKVTSMHGAGTSELLDGLLEKQHEEMGLLRFDLLNSERKGRKERERKAALKRFNKAKSQAIKEARKSAKAKGEAVDAAAAAAAEAFGEFTGGSRGEGVNGGMDEEEEEADGDEHQHYSEGGSYSAGAAAAGASAGNRGNDRSGAGGNSGSGSGGGKGRGLRRMDTFSDDDRKEAAVALESGGARAVVDHPSQLERTKLLEGKVTCSTLRVGGVVDRTVLQIKRRERGDTENEREMK